MIAMPQKTEFDFEAYLGKIDAMGMVPTDAVCVFTAGSLALGWGNATSDADYFAITAAPWTGETNGRNSTHSGDAPGLSMAVYVGKRRVDVEYWTETQIDQLIDNVSWEQYDMNKTLMELVTIHDFDVLQRIMHACPLRNSDWLAIRQERVNKSALRALAVARNFTYTDIFIEDCVGQLEAGDLRSAVISARLAFGYAIDALLFSVGGGVGGNTLANKWRARHLAEVEQDVIAFDEYWAIETMRDYDDDDPAAWVERVVLACRQVCLEVSVT